MAMQLVKEPELKIGDISLSDHAWERVQERLGRNYNNRHHATTHLRSQLKNAKFIGETVDEEGNPSYLYAIGRIGIYLSLDCKVIKTVIRHEHVTYEKIKNKIAQLHERELYNLRRKERAIIRRNKTEKLKLKVELAQLDLREYKTRSKNVKQQCRQRREEIEKYIKELDKELKQIQDTIRQVSYSMVAVL
jgi:vacuolar-type H+-ATPase subunit I/STV1